MTNVLSRNPFSKLAHQKGGIGGKNGNGDGKNNQSRIVLAVIDDTVIWHLVNKMQVIAEH